MKAKWKTFWDRVAAGLGIFFGLCWAIGFYASFATGCAENITPKIHAQPNVRKRCVDTRDGQVFFINSHDIENAWAGVGGHVTYDVHDEDGQLWHITSDSVAYIKCEDVDE